MRDGVLIDPVLPEGFGSTPNEERPASHDRFWHRPFVNTGSCGNGRIITVHCLDGGAWDRPTMLGGFPTVEEAVRAINRNELRRLKRDVERPDMDIIDIHISGIGHDRNGNLVGRLVARRGRVIVADSGRSRRQLHGGYREAARSWLGSLGIEAKAVAVGSIRTGENSHGRVVEAWFELNDISREESGTASSHEFG